jgi:hypothetical protein
VTDSLAIKLHKEVFKMNGFKVIPKDLTDDSCNVYLIKSLPLIKKSTFSINGMCLLLTPSLDFYELLEIVNQNLDYEKTKGLSEEESKLMHKETLRPSKIY